MSNVQQAPAVPLHKRPSWAVPARSDSGHTAHSVLDSPMHPAPYTQHCVFGVRYSVFAPQRSLPTDSGRGRPRPADALGRDAQIAGLTRRRPASIDHRHRPRRGVRIAAIGDDRATKLSAQCFDQDRSDSSCKQQRIKQSLGWTEAHPGPSSPLSLPSPRLLRTELSSVWATHGCSQRRHAAPARRLCA